MNRASSAMVAWALLAACAAQAEIPAVSPNAGTQAQDTHPARDTIEASVERGAVAFQHYCSLCHGVTADGNGRAAKLYTPRPGNLNKTDKNATYVDLIIRRGGGAIGRSPFMPPWNDELTEEQIRDLVNYIGSISSAYAPK